MKQKIIISLLFVLFFCMASVLRYTVVENPETIDELFTEPRIKSASISFTEPFPEIIPNRFMEARDVCGTDDRVRSSDAAVGRIFMGGIYYCTGFIIETGAIITAGHCIETILDDGIDSYIEFNVPASEPDRTPNPSKEWDQYKIDESKLVVSEDWDYHFSFAEQDWAVIEVFENELTGMLPIAAQNAFL